MFVKVGTRFQQVISGAEILLTSLAPSSYWEFSRIILIIHSKVNFSAFPPLIILKLNVKWAPEKSTLFGSRRLFQKMIVTKMGFKIKFRCYEMAHSTPQFDWTIIFWPWSGYGSVTQREIRGFICLTARTSSSFNIFYDSWIFRMWVSNEKLSVNLITVLRLLVVLFIASQI